MSPEERDEFDCDVKKIHWPTYLEQFNRGIQIYATGQDQVPTSHNMTQILIRNKDYFDDIKETL